MSLEELSVRQVARVGGFPHAPVELMQVPRWAEIDQNMQEKFHLSVLRISKLCMLACGGARVTLSSVLPVSLQTSCVCVAL